MESVHHRCPQRSGTGTSSPSAFDLHVVHDVADSAANDIPEDRDVVVMCRSGMRSQMAIMLLNQSGIESSRLYNLTGGIMAWGQIAPEDIHHG